MRSYNLFTRFMTLAVVLVTLLWGVDQTFAKNDKEPPGQAKKITQADRQAAAARSLQAGALNPLMVDPQAAP